MSLSWMGFFIAIAIILVGSRRHLGLSLITGGIVLGLFTLTPLETLKSIYITLTDPSVVLLTVALTMIPVIGGILQESGGLDRIVKNLRIGKKPFLGLSPSLLGLLPIPGGALFSAPLVGKAGRGLEPDVKSGINIWFRHVLFFIYPLAPALLIPAKIANIPVYTVIKYQFPFFLISILMGYFFLLNKAEGEMEYFSEPSLKRLFPPLSVILLAPFLDFTIQKAFEFGITEVSTLIAISSSLLLAIYISESRIRVIKKSIERMKPWNFTVLMLGIFIFINMFKSSGIGSLIASLSLSRLTLAIGIGFLLGLATGRIILPASIVIPIFLATLSLGSLPPIIFSLMFFAVFMGYVMTPVHPCVGVTLEYFDAKMEDFLRLLLPPVAISLVIAASAFLLLVQ